MTARCEQLFERLACEVAEVIADVAPFDAELGPSVIEEARDEPIRLSG